MSHTPMTKEAARSLEKEIRDIERAFERFQRHLVGKKRVDRTESKYQVILDSPAESADELFKGLIRKK